MLARWECDSMNVHTFTTEKNIVGELPGTQSLAGLMEDGKTSEAFWKDTCTQEKARKWWTKMGIQKEKKNRIFSPF